MRIYLKNARKEKGMTQKELADLLGISVRSYQNIEQGRRLGKIPMWDALEDLFEIHQRELRKDK